MKARSFTLAKRQACCRPGLIRYLKLERVRQERRAVKVLLRSGVQDVPPIIKSRTGAWEIS